MAVFKVQRNQSEWLMVLLCNKTKLEKCIVINRSIWFQTRDVAWNGMFGHCYGCAIQKNSSINYCKMCKRTSSICKWRSLCHRLPAPSKQEMKWGKIAKNDLTPKISRIDGSSNNKIVSPTHTLYQLCILKNISEFGYLGL